MSHYDVVLEELRYKKERLASEYIIELYFILSEEERLAPKECRDKIEIDCKDIWSVDTIRKYLPPEAKNKTKRKAGKISAELKKLRKGKEGAAVKEEETKQLVVVNSSINGSTASTTTTDGQVPALIDNNKRTNGNIDNIENSVEMNPTENRLVGQKKLEFNPFQEVQGIPDEDYFFSLLLIDRHKEEALEELNLRDEFTLNSLLVLPPQLAEQIYIDMNTSRTLRNIPGFELEHNGTDVVAVRKLQQQRK